MLKIIVVSDATGETGERVVRSALTQFGDVAVSVVRCGGVRSPEQVRAVVAEAALRDSLIVHTLVSDNLRKVMLQEARIHAVDAMDLMEPALDRLAFHLGVSPQEKPGLLSQLTEAASRRIEAVEFAFRHDNGQRVEKLEGAEIVPGIEPAPALLAVPHERVFGLVMSAPRLAELRRARAEHLGIPAEGYASLEGVREELAQSQALCQHNGWRRIDVTGKSVEEVSREILLLGRHEVGRDHDMR